MDDFDTTGRVYWINHIDKTTQLFPPKDDPVDLDSLHPGIKAEVRTTSRHPNRSAVLHNSNSFAPFVVGVFALFRRPCLSSRPTSAPS